MKRLAILLLTSLLATTALAVEPAEKLADPALEARARVISQGLRCLVCRNESIDESHADLAHDVRVLLRERLVAGDTNPQAVAYIVARYGDFVLLEPPVKRSTYVLWLAPPVLLALGGLGALIAMRRQAGQAGPAPLSAEEGAQLAKLMQTDTPERPA